ncbi:MAG: Biopolymer transport protein ExbD/TolR, partial [Pseudomonadota bacterium]
MRFPRRRPDAPALELAPLVDVLFLLLVFFMVASRFPEVP